MHDRVSGIEVTQTSTLDEKVTKKIEVDWYPYWPNNIDRYPADGHSFDRPKLERSFFRSQNLNFIKKKWFHRFSRPKNDPSTDFHELRSIFQI